MSKKKMTKTEALKICNWCGLLLQLGGWDITLYYQDNVPEAFEKAGDDDVGYSQTRRLVRQADIWVGPSRHETNYEIIDTICHEMAHVFLEDRDIVVRYDSADNLHSTLYCLASILAKAYKAGVK